MILQSLKQRPVSSFQIYGNHSKDIFYTDETASSHCNRVNSYSLQWRHMGTMASLITGVSIVCSAVCSGADQRKHQSSVSLAFVRGIQRWPVNSHHKGQVTQKMFPFDYVIMLKVDQLIATAVYQLKSVIIHGYKWNSLLPLFYALFLQ